MNLLLEKWLKYVELEALMQTRIDLSEINELQFLSLDLESINTSGNVHFNVSSDAKNLIFNKFIDNDFSMTKKVVVSYPYAIIKQKGKEYIRPLFIFEIDLSDFKKESNFITLNVFGDSGYSPVAEFFEQDFKIDRDIFIDNISFYRQLNKFLDKPEENFSSAMQKFCTSLNELKTNKHIIDIKYDYCVIHEVDSGFLAKKMRDSIRVLKNVNVQASLLEAYISKKNTPSKNSLDKPYFGKFNNGKILSSGQEKAIKSLYNGEKISAVQGGPGTGKTTLFLSVIASAITHRAISLIKGHDFNNQMVVVSVANKAIDNIVDEFKKQDFLDQYNDFYFLTGSAEQLNISIDRMQNYLDFLETAKFDKDKHAALAKEIMEIVHFMDSEKQKNIQIKTLYEHGIKQEPTHQKNITAWVNAQQELKKIFNTDISEIKEIAHNGKVFFDELKAFLNFQTEQYMCERFYNNISEIYSYSLKINEKINKVPWYYPEKIFGKRKKYLRKFFDSYGELVSSFKIEEIDNYEFFVEKIVNPLQVYYDFYESIKSKHQLHQHFLLSFENIHIVNNLLKLESNWRESRTFLNKFSKIKEDYAQIKNFDDDRVIFSEKQEELFLLSVRFLRMEQIKRKHLIKYALNNMRNILIGNQSRRISKSIYEAGLVNFFKEFSLVYPVLTTTMASSWNLTKDFVYSFDTQEGDEKVVDYISGFKPFYLILSDESGMTKIHEPASLLYAADAALVVGDTKQLPPIYNIAPNVAENFELENFKDISDAEIFSPTIASFYHRAAGCKTSNFDDIGSSLILDEHRRCQPNIANLFIEIGNYTGIQIKTPPLSLEDQEKLRKFSDGNDVVFVNTNGKAGPFKHTNIEEIDNIEKVLDKLEASGFDISKSVGIITPYVAQKELLIQRFASRVGHSKNQQKIGTIHSFQGAEFDVVLFSPVIFNNKDSGAFLNAKPNILIVAISRAKMLFVSICNSEKLISSGGSLLKIISRSEELNV